MIEPLYKIWTQNELDFNKSLFLFLAAGVSFSNFGIGFVNYFFGVNKLKQFTYITVSKSLSLFVIAYLLVGYNDLSTVGLSVAVSEFVSSVIIPIYLMRIEKKLFFDDNGTKFFILSIIPPLLISLLALFDYFNFFTYIMVIVVLLVIIVIYYFTWKIIDKEVKGRLIGIINKYLKIK